MTTQDKWDLLRNGFVASSQAVLGSDNRRQPDWFRDDANTLQPLFCHIMLCLLTVIMQLVSNKTTSHRPVEGKSGYSSTKTLALKMLCNQPCEGRKDHDRTSSDPDGSKM